MQPVRVIAGLGNPGRQYDGTRHNIGFAVVDLLARTLGATWKDSTRYRARTASVLLADRPVLLVKPLTFMNMSGLAIQAICRFHRWKPGQLVVVHDEFQIELGRVKVSFGGSAGGHNGVADIIARMGEAFTRYRIGIGPREQPRQTLEDFVLAPFAPDELSLIQQHMERFADGLHSLVRDGVEPTMNRLNQRSNT
jgi:PTH1 family peptidyl-tRNA hydrolase